VVGVIGLVAAVMLPAEIRTSETLDVPQPES
jgi:hypothetical protein